MSEKIYTAKEFALDGFGDLGIVVVDDNIFVLGDTIKVKWKGETVFTFRKARNVLEDKVNGNYIIDNKTISKEKYDRMLKIANGLYGMKKTQAMLNTYIYSPNEDATFFAIFNFYDSVNNFIAAVEREY